MARVLIPPLNTIWDQTLHIGKHTGMEKMIHTSAPIVVCFFHLSLTFLYFKKLLKTTQHKICPNCWIFWASGLWQLLQLPQNRPTNPGTYPTNNTTKKDTWYMEISHTTHKCVPFHHLAFRQPRCCFFIPGSTCPKDGEILGRWMELWYAQKSSLMVARRFLHYFKCFDDSI